MTKVTEVEVLCGLIEIAIRSEKVDPHQLTELFQLVRVNPSAHTHILQRMSQHAKHEFALYCCLQGRFYIGEIGNSKNSAGRLLYSALQLTEIGMLLDILGDDHE